MSVDHYSGLEMGASPFTISLWYKSTGGNIPDTYLFHKGTHSADYGALGTGKWMGIQYKAGERLTFAIDDNSTKTELNITSPDQYFDGEWHQFVGMRDVSNDMLKVYIDGVKIMEAKDNTGDITEQAELVLGNCNYSFDTPFMGYMDELEIYKDAFSDEEVAYLYNRALVSVFHVSSHPVSLQLYPNPFTDRLIIDAPDDAAGILTIKIVDLSGKLIHTTTAENNSSKIILDGLGSIPEGFYTCIVSSVSRHYIGKVFKIK